MNKLRQFILSWYYKKERTHTATILLGFDHKAKPARMTSFAPPAFKIPIKITT
jgi:hypothetical protein